MKEFNGLVIYNPSGRAGEYSYWAANFYVGCSNGCTYCYLKKSRGKKVLGGDTAELKKTLKNEIYAMQMFQAELMANKEELQKCGLFFSFTTDPLLTETIGLTVLAIDFCQKHKVPVKLLSKCAEGMEAIINISESSEWDVSKIAIGTTLTGCDELEPKASPNQYRVVALQRAKNHGFRTFASVEPIPVDSFHRALAVIKLAYPWTDLFKIGLESGAKYPKREIDLFYNAVTTFWETIKPAARIYWKDGFLKAAKIEREELPGYCVERNFNIFGYGTKI